jgi:hypothetical protein
MGRNTSEEMATCASHSRFQNHSNIQKIKRAYVSQYSTRYLHEERTSGAVIPSHDTRHTNGGLNEDPVTALFRWDNRMTRGKVDQSGSRRTSGLHQFSMRTEQGYGYLDLALPIRDR